MILHVMNLSPGVLWGVGLGVPLAAASVPIIIHIINLTRYRRVEWAAMEFLLAAYRRTRRRFQIENLVMLALRVLGVVLLACALFPMGCEQIGRGLEGIVGTPRLPVDTGKPLHLVVVLDNSASMALSRENQSSFDRAKQLALKVVDGLEQGRDRVSLVRLSDVYVPQGGQGGLTPADDVAQVRRRRVGQLANLDVEAARREVAATPVAYVDTNMLAALKETQRLLESTPAGDRVALQVISDFAASGWRELLKDGAGNPEFKATLDAIGKKLAGAEAVFNDVGLEGASNFAIVNLRSDQAVIGEGMEATVFVDVAYFSTSSEPGNTKFEFSIDGAASEPFGRSVSLAPNRIEPTAVELKLTEKHLRLKPEEQKQGGASRAVQVSVSASDGLKYDNTRSIILHIVPNVPILVVNGIPEPRNVELDETAYLEQALGISSARPEERGAEIRITPNLVTSVPPAQLTSIESFLSYRLIVLANVTSVPEAVVAKLEEFVRAGYSLVVFDGERIDHGRYNDTLYNNGKGLLPCRLKGPEGSNDVVAPMHSILIPKDVESHPALSLFTRTADDRKLVEGPQVIRNWRGVTLPEGAEIDPLRPVRVLLAVNKGQDPPPLMVERPFGRGRVVYVATTASQRWHDMWREGLGMPLYLFHELVGYLTDTEARFSSLMVGEPLRRVLSQQEISPHYTIRDAAGSQNELVASKADGLDLLEFPSTSAPGIYTMSGTVSPRDTGAGVRWSEKFAVNAEARESDIARVQQIGGGRALDVVLREAAPEGFAFRVQSVTQGSGSADLDMTQDPWEDLWVWLAVAACAFFLMESAWSAVISRPEH
jgi:hypothetical protein